MPAKVIILHGYSDCSESFQSIKAYLIQNGVGSAQTILYGDYESREDSLTYNDVADGLNDAFKQAGILAADGTALADLHVLVHSTGGLVIRHWIASYYGANPGACPVKKIVMLAPANFGSPLAHRGKSFLGSLFKGRWKIGDFLEVGRTLLDGLELGSPFQWNLAHKDLLRPDPYFHADGIQLTVLVGVRDYDGILGWVNKPGTDGTVVISGTSLDTVKLTCAFSGRSDASDPSYHWKKHATVDQFAFGVLPDVNHGTIVDDFATKGVGELVLSALRADKPAFLKLIDELEGLTQRTYRAAAKPQFQQFIVRAVDDLGEELRDFNVEFYISLVEIRDDAGGPAVRVLPKEDARSSAEVNGMICSEFHAHTGNPAFRRFLVDPEAVLKRVLAAQGDLGKDIGLCMRISIPPVEKGIRYEDQDLGSVLLYCPGLKERQAVSFFSPNTTTLIELCVNRVNDYITLGPDPRKH